MSVIYAGAANAAVSSVSFPMKDNDGDRCSVGFDCIGIGESVTVDGNGDNIPATIVTSEQWQALLGMASVMFSELCGADVASPVISKLTKWTDNLVDADDLVPREMKWRVAVQDVVNGKTFTHDFPCALPPGGDWSAGDSLPSESLAKINAFLAGPVVLVDGVEHNIPLIISPYGNPMRAMSGYVAGCRYKKTGGVRRMVDNVPTTMQDINFMGFSRTASEISAPVGGYIFLTEDANNYIVEYRSASVAIEPGTVYKYEDGNVDILINGIGISLTEFVGEIGQKCSFSKAMYKLGRMYPSAVWKQATYDSPVVKYCEAGGYQWVDGPLTGMNVIYVDTNGTLVSLANAEVPAGTNHLANNDPERKIFTSDTNYVRLIWPGIVGLVDFVSF